MEDKRRLVAYLLTIFITAFLLSCSPKSGKVPIHQVVGSPTVRVKVAVVKSEEADPVHQRFAVREFESALRREPASVAVSRIFRGKEVDLVIVTPKKVKPLEKVSPSVIKREGRKSDLHALIVLDPMEISYDEVTEKKKEEVCVLRKAKAVVSVTVYDTKGADVLMAGVYEGESSAKQCSKGIKRTDKLPSKDLLIVKALKRAAYRFAKEFWANL